jgi:hypothetical protein
MDVRKATQVIQPQTNQTSEVTKTKSTNLNPIADSFEKANAQSSSSNSASTASSEPEKKAGQITGGILIKQMTAAQLGETTTGKKELSPEQQSSVSKSNPQKTNLKPSSSFQDARSRFEDSKNSGLQVPFAPKKGEASSQASKVDKDQIVASLGQSSSEQTSNAVKDADRLVDGGSLRSQVDAEVAERHQDSNALGGSRNDRLSDLLNPTAKGPQQSGQTHGKDQFAFGSGFERGEAIMDYLAKKDGKYDHASTRENKDGSTTYIFDEAGVLDSGGVYQVHSEDTHKKDQTRTTDEKRTELRGDDTKVETRTKSNYDANGNLTKSTTTTTTTEQNDTVKVKTEITTRNKDGTYTKTTTEPTTATGKPVSYDRENYTGNIPDAVKKTMEYFKQQVAAQKPSSGGETVLTDDSASGGTITGGPVSNFVAQQGIAGLSNPGSRDAVDGGTTGGQGHLGSQSGGNVDFGQDSDQVGYNGITHEDDPSDVQFGPTEQPKEQTDAKKDEESNDSSSTLDPLRKKRRDI